MNGSEFQTRSDLDPFINPRSVAIIGATERPGSWGSFIMRGMRSMDYPGNLYPVNHRAEKVFGIPAFKDVREIKGLVELAVLTIPETSVEEAIRACGEKHVKGITIITAGFAETSDEGKTKQATIADLARSYGLRLLGPNVSGTFNLHAGFNAAASPAHHLHPASLKRRDFWYLN